MLFKYIAVEHIVMLWRDASRDLGLLALIGPMIAATVQRMTPGVAFTRLVLEALAEDEARQYQQRTNNAPYNLPEPPRPLARD